MKIILVFLAFLFLCLFAPYVFSYNREAYLESELNRMKGCAFSDCPQRVQEKTLDEMNGLYPTAYYEYHSKAWWRSFCTYSQEFCTK